MPGRSRARFSLLLVLMLITQVAKAQVTQFNSANAVVETKVINSASKLTISGSTTGQIQSGDCIVVSLDNPYPLGANYWASSSLSSDQFYAPFPATGTSYTVDAGANPAMDVATEGSTGTELKFTATSAATSDSFSFTVNSFQTFYSKVLNQRFKIKLMQGCSTVVTCQVVLNRGSLGECASESISLATTATYATPLITSSSQIVGASDSTATITIGTSSDFTKYPATLEIALPTWYGTTNEFSFAPSVTCSCNDLNGISNQFTQSGTQGYLKISYNAYTGSGSTVVIACDNFRNPVYNKAVTGFSITYKDREIFSQEAFTYPTFQLNKQTYTPVTVASSNVQVNFYDGSGKHDANNPIEVQKANTAIEISFSMPIPVESSGCYMKVKFPTQFNLPRAQLIYMGFEAFAIYNGQGVTISNTLGLGSQVWNDYQEQARGNYIIFKGCATAGSNPLAKIQISGPDFETIEVVRNTDDFSLTVFKNYDVAGNTLSDQILSATRSLEAQFFTSATLTGGSFTAANAYIQQGTAYTIQFTLTNDLAKVQSGISGGVLLVIFPEIMPHSTNPTVTSLDGSLLDAQIARNTTYYDDQSGRSINCASSTQACYRITYSNTRDVTAGTRLSLLITGPENAVSVRTAGQFYIQTQKYVTTGSTTVAYQLNYGAFDSGFTTKKGGITPTPGQTIQSTSPVTYAQATTTTIYYTMDNHVPVSGYIEIILPKSMDFSSAPQVTSSNSAYFSGSKQSQTQSTSVQNAFVQAFTTSKMPAGSHEIRISNVRNPRSLEPTESFIINTYDQFGNLIGNGTGGNIQMTSPGNFPKMEVTGTNRSNGASSDYTVAWTAAIPMVSGDTFHMKFPSEMKTPIEPICEAIDCIKEISCTAEKGTIIAALTITDRTCLNTNQKFSFKVDAMTNAPTMLPATVPAASIFTSSFQQVASSNAASLEITNNQWGYLDRSKIQLEATSVKVNGISTVARDYGAKNQYILRFEPTNPIPKLSWVVIEYPIEMKMTSSDETEFVKDCQAQTSQQYIGSKYCRLITKDRVIIFQNIFEGDFAAQVTLLFTMTNPETNFRKNVTAESLDEQWAYNRTQTFFIRTVTFNLGIPQFQQYASMKVNGYPQADVDKFYKELNSKEYSQLNKTFFVGIDSYPWNDIYPPLKCNPPCRLCSDSNPNDCLSCWGNNTLPGTPYTKVFLQDALKYDGSKTCVSKCFDKYTTNSDSSDFVTDSQTGKIDWAKSFFKCTLCDISCGTCKGQDKWNPPPKSGLAKDFDKYQCTSCSKALGFAFFIEKENKCASQCTTGYYQKTTGACTGISFECGICQPPCRTCRKCCTEDRKDANGKLIPADKHCNISAVNPLLDTDPSSAFCTGCFQGKFYPFHVDDIELVSDYVRFSRGMYDNEAYTLKPENIDAIKAKYKSLDIPMDEFLRQTVGSIDQNTGLRTPNALDVSKLTYKEMYAAQYKKFNFPERNLQDNRCIKHCPNGTASIDGICLNCKGNCKTCRGSLTKCTSCDKTGSHPYHYGRVCYTACPEQTATDEKNKKCIGCTSGCLRCKHNDPNYCLNCASPLLLFTTKDKKNATCKRICPTGYVPNFFGTECIPEGQLPIIWFPMTLFTILAYAICWATQFSSKNTQQQHKVFLSFFAMSGVIHSLGVWLQLVVTFIPGQGQIAMLLVPVVAIVLNCLLSSVYNNMWEMFAPEIVLNTDEHGSLTQRECEAVRDADQWFLKWADKYEDTAYWIRAVVKYFSYKLFFMPYTHFMGYPRFTLRSQDYEVIWEWQQDQCEKYQNGGNLANPTKMLPSMFFDPHSSYRFPGQIMPKRDPDASIVKYLTMHGKHKVIKQKFIIEWENQQNEFPFEEMPHEDQKKTLNKVWEYMPGFGLQSVPFDEKDDDQNKKISDVETSPYNYLQHSYLTPYKDFMMVKDTRLKDKYKEYMNYDTLGVMLVIALGDLICIFAYLMQYPVNQLLVECIEMPILSILQIYMCYYLKNHWEEQRLPLNMKDGKYNYMFKNKMIHDFDEDHEIMGGPPKFEIWDQNAKLYDFVKVFQQNKLEELLEVFGRRQCKSCIEFNTGTEKVEDDRKIKSWPLSPQAEKDYAGRAGEFNLIDFQLQNNVYAEEAEPTAMFESVARDFSEFGAQVFAFDIQEALNRKGGNLVTPGLDDDRRKKDANKKRRGRKNKYHKLIDQEDDQEANQMTEEDDADGLDKVDEEDEDDDEELIRKKKEEEARLAAAKAAAEKKRLEDEEAARRKQAEQDRLDREKKDEEDRLLREQAEQERRAAEKARIEAELAKQADEDYQSNIVEEFSPDKRRAPSDIDSQFSGMQVKENALGNFKRQQQQDVLEAPPKFESRRFNECDIIGDYTRDEKGNVQAGEPDESSNKWKDKSGNESNNRGYLVDPEGNVIDNLNGEQMFKKDDMDERGEVPAPFCIEKHNFNPHLVRGDFDYDRNDKAIVKEGDGGTIMGRSPEKKTPKKMQGSPNKAAPGPEFKDKRGSKVSSRGYRIDEEGHMVDNHGRKKFDRAHMTEDGDLPKLFNYNGRRFDITDCMGTIDKDEFGYYIWEQDKNGRRVDKLGRPINSKGYLCDDQGNVIDKDGKQLFEFKHLYEDDIPKIFPFTKFNIKNILGDFEMDPIGNPILDRDQLGNLIERQGRRVNIKGYLIDEQGNVIDKRGKIMFEKHLLDSEQDIPKVFRTGLLKSDTASSLSRLMDEIGRNQPSEMGDEEGDGKPRSRATSVDSMMDETPYKYYNENKGIADMEDDEEYDEEDDHSARGGARAQEEGGPDMAKVRRKKKKKKKKRKKRPEEIEDPSLREHLMAGAYGGIAKPKIKRPGVKYTTDIDSGIKDLAMQPMMSGLGRDSSNQNIDKASLVDAVISKNVKNFVKNMVPSEIGSAAGKKRVMEATSKLLDPQQREAMLKQQEMEKIRKKKVAQVKRLRQKGMLGEKANDVDFEKMFGKDIDEFLEDSEWDIESIDKMSHFSKGSKATIRSSAAVSSRLKGMEKVYLQNTTQSGLKLNAQGNSNIAPSKKGKGKHGQKFRGSGNKGDSDIESVNSRGVPKPPRKKAWDTGSRRSSQKRI